MSPDGWMAPLERWGLGGLPGWTGRAFLDLICVLLSHDSEAAWEQVVVGG